MPTRAATGLLILAAGLCFGCVRLVMVEYDTEQGCQTTYVNWLPDGRRPRNCDHMRDLDAYFVSEDGKCWQSNRCDLHTLDGFYMRPGPGEVDPCLPYVSSDTLPECE